MSLWIYPNGIIHDIIPKYVDKYYCVCVPKLAENSFCGNEIDGFDLTLKYILIEVLIKKIK